MKFSYAKVCSELLKFLSSKQKEILSRRFGLKEETSKKKETLAAIGLDLGVTRERVRQIERDSLLKLKSAVKNYQKVFNYFKNYLREKGGICQEEILLTELGQDFFQNEVYFLLTLCEDFVRIKESDNFYAVWIIKKDSWDLAKKIIADVYTKFKKTKQPLTVEELNKDFSLPIETLTSYLMVSKQIQQNNEGFWGLKDWAEINPKRIKDKIYVVFKKNQKPLHFTEISKLIDHALPQTVHNELIKDSRFVLVGRGLYALREWGYEEGFVKDIILKILKNANRPLPKEEILEKVLQQRLVKKNTILLNLNNKNYFSKNSEGYYTIKEA